MRRLSLAFGLAAFLAFLPSSLAQDVAPEPGESFVRARVMEIVREERSDAGGMERTLQQVRLRLLDGAEKGEEILLENAVIGDREGMRLGAGETVVARMLVKVDGSVEYVAAERYRLPGMGMLLVFFLILTVIFGRLTGLRSLLGLAVSILILVFYVVPFIARGSNPVLVSLVGSVAIACTSLFLAHGFTRRTSVAFLSTAVTLACSVVLAFVFVRVARLFGMGSEEALFLQGGGFGNVDLRGLLLGGIIIGTLGVLDDITTAQTAAVDEVHKANPALGRAALLRAGFSVGREHIASLINTLALAYAGASLPLLLLFTADVGQPLWVTLNSEFLAEEIIRTLVGSSALLLAVPISTWFAVGLLGRKRA
ncbi:MAG: YibE/F family protein [Candidatus Peribacteraceae bacterium]|nr:YibE/F family protein [Candidatus Peribacteraceae bacterium]